ncbi:ABC transporter substrate-binding protein [Hahella ganghwensis]|uniref:ABC transporter substrate-binding protein n=1 Tax=Hahella ganghwensis TaxID=286420 RepID=UPI00037AD4DB|nr:ABC transporter substrate-binding protein [Hahella ganghwensis]
MQCFGSGKTGGGMREISRLWLSLGTIALLMLLSVSVRAEMSVVIAVSKTPLSAPFYVAEREGFFKAEGLNVEVRECLGGHRCMKELLEGRADFATCSDMVITQQAALEKSFYVLSTFVTSADDTQIVVRRGAGIENPSDMVSKRIGYVKGSASHYFADIFLLLGGADPQNNTFVELQPEQMPDALYKGEVDVIAIWQPWSYLALKKSGNNAFVMNELKPYTVTFNLIGQVNLIDNNPQLAVRLLRSLVRAEQFILQDGEFVKEIVEEHTGMNGKVLDAIWPSYQFHVSLTQQFLLTLQNEYYWLKQQDPHGQKYKKDALDFRDYVMPELLQQLDITRVHLNQPPE